MCQKCEEDCGLWVLIEIIQKKNPENMKKNCGSRLGVTFPLKLSWIGCAI